MKWLNGLREAFLRWWRKESKEEKKIRQDRAFDEACFYVGLGRSKDSVIEKLLQSGYVFTKKEAEILYERVFVWLIVKGLTDELGIWRVEYPRIEGGWHLAEKRLRKEGVNPTLIQISKDRYGGELVRYLRERGKRGAEIAKRLRLEGFTKHEAYDILMDEPFHRFQVIYPDGSAREYSETELKKLRKRDLAGTKIKTLRFFFVAVLNKEGIGISPVALEALKQNTQRSFWGDVAAIPQLFRQSLRLRRKDTQKEAMGLLSQMGNLDLEFVDWPDPIREYKGFLGWILKHYDRLWNWLGPKMETILVILAIGYIPVIVFLMILGILLFGFGGDAGGPLEGPRRG